MYNTLRKEIKLQNQTFYDNWHFKAKKISYPVLRTLSWSVTLNSGTNRIFWSILNFSFCKSSCKNNFPTFWDTNKSLALACLKSIIKKRLIQCDCAVLMLNAKLRYSIHVNSMHYLKSSTSLYVQGRSHKR